MYLARGETLQNAKGAAVHGCDVASNSIYTRIYDLKNYCEMAKNSSGEEMAGCTP